MRKLSHESLTVYQRSVGFVACSSHPYRSKREIAGEIQNQYKRAVISIPLNIAEGAGEQSGKDQVAEIIAMLTSLSKNVAGDRVNEVSLPYSTFS